MTETATVQDRLPLADNGPELIDLDGPDALDFNPAIEGDTLAWQTVAAFAAELKTRDHERPTKPNMWDILDVGYGFVVWHPQNTARPGHRTWAATPEAAVRLMSSAR